MKLKRLSERRLSKNILIKEVILKLSKS